MLGWCLWGLPGMVFEAAWKALGAVSRILYIYIITYIHTDICGHVRRPFAWGGPGTAWRPLSLPPSPPPFQPERERESILSLDGALGLPGDGVLEVLGWC